MRAGPGAQYAEMPPSAVSDTGRVADRQAAAYAAELAARSTYPERRSRVPAARTCLDGLAEVRAAG